MKLNRTAIAVMTFGLALTPFVSQAAVKSSQINETRVLITYNQADLNTPHGRRALERQIEDAAETVCDVDDFRNSRSLRDYTKARSCYKGAVESAKAEIGSGELFVTAAY